MLRTSWLPPFGGGRNHMPCVEATRSNGTQSPHRLFLAAWSSAHADRTCQHHCRGQRIPATERAASRYRTECHPVRCRVSRMASRTIAPRNLCPVVREKRARAVLGISGWTFIGCLLGGREGMHVRCGGAYALLMPEDHTDERLQRGSSEAPRRSQRAPMHQIVSRPSCQPCRSGRGKRILRCPHDRSSRTRRHLARS